MAGQWWDNDPDTALSKKMSDILRHRADKFGLAMREDGYVDVRDMLAIDRGRFFAGYTEQDVWRVVQNNVKKRFSLEEGERAEFLVRANQGHTLGGVEDDSLLVEVTCFAELERRGEVCVHGTYQKCWETIRMEGLKPMGRNHVHFAPRAPADAKQVISGMRATSEILIYLDATKALRAGMKIYRSTNGVLLTRGLKGVVGLEFFQKVTARGGHQIWPELRQAPLGERRVPGSGPMVVKGKTNRPADSNADATRSKLDRKEVVPEVVAESWEDLDSEDQGAAPQAEASPSESVAVLSRSVPEKPAAPAAASAAPAPAALAAPAAPATASKIADTSSGWTADGWRKEVRKPESGAAAVADVPVPAVHVPSRERDGAASAPAEAEAEAARCAPSRRRRDGDRVSAAREDPQSEKKAPTSNDTPEGMQAHRQREGGKTEFEPAALQAVVASEETGDQLQKELRNLEKKLKSILELETKAKQGDTLDDDLSKKLASKAEVEDKACQLRRRLGDAKT